MMQFFSDDWILLFQETNHAIVMIHLPSHLVYDDSFIINDILLFSNLVSTFLHYFSCIARVFSKYRFPFKLKNVIFKPRVDFFGHDLTARGNYLVKMVPPTPRNQIYSSLVCVASIIDIVPNFETNIKPL